MKIPVGVNYLRCRTFNHDVNTSIQNVYQVGAKEVRTETLVELLTDIAKRPLFDSLRTKEQLAYSVSWQWESNYGTLFYTISVRSHENKHSVEHVDDRIENFRHDLLSIIDGMSDDAFDAIKESLKNEHCGFSEEVSNHWHQILGGDYEFDWKKKKAECLSGITKTDLLSFYRSQ